MLKLVAPPTKGFEIGEVIVHEVLIPVMNDQVGGASAPLTLWPEVFPIFLKRSPSAAHRPIIAGHTGGK
jgi:hypothetical protein